MTTYYVDGDVGNDANAGTSEGSGNAWATIHKATQTLVSGDVCYVKRKANDAYYDENAVTANAGTDYRTNNMKMIGYETTPGDGGKVLWTASGGTYLLNYASNLNRYWLWYNFQWEGGTTGHVRSTTGWAFSNCVFLNSGNAAVASLQCPGGPCPVVDQCAFINPAGYAIENASNYQIISRCYFSGNAGSNLQHVYTGSGWTIYRNVFRNYNAASSAQTGIVSRFELFAANTVDYESGTNYPKYISNFAGQTGGACCDNILWRLEESQAIILTTQAPICFANNILLSDNRTDGYFCQSNTPYTAHADMWGYDPFDTSVLVGEQATIWSDYNTPDYNVASGSPLQDAGSLPKAYP